MLFTAKFVIFFVFCDFPR